MSVRIGVATVSLAAAALLTSCGGGNSGSASCAPPSLHTKNSTPGPGRPNHVTVSTEQQLTVQGRGYGACRDNNHAPDPSPFHDLAVVVEQGDFREKLATVSAEAPSGTFTVDVELPAELRPGKATLRTSYSGERRLRLHIRD